MNKLQLLPGYFDSIVNDFDLVIETATSELNNSDIDFDTVVGTGLSGSLLTPQLGRSLKKNWAVIRKNNESSHDGNPFVGTLGSRWIFVDDFIATGSTFLAVEKAIRDAVNQRRAWDSKYINFSTKCVGDYCYSRTYDRIYSATDIQAAAQ